jgi:hypothetical protein
MKILTVFVLISILDDKSLSFELCSSFTVDAFSGIVVLLLKKPRYICNTSVIISYVSTRMPAKSCNIVKDVMLRDRLITWRWFPNQHLP